MTEKYIIGIDLGTTNSCVAIWRNQKLEIIPDKNNRTIPSVVAFTHHNTYVGQEAKHQTELNPKNVIYEVKRLIGKTSTDLSVEQDIQFLTYTIDQSENSILLPIDLNQPKMYTPEQISAFILGKLKTLASDYLKQEVTDAVITVPAYFNDAQRQATKYAAQIAGLNCVRILNEPTAAAIAYGLEYKVHDKETNILVYDLGGGTLDVSLLTIDSGIFEVIASTGNTHLGGADFDNRIIQYCLDSFERQYNIQIKELPGLSLQKLKKQVETSKRQLSYVPKTSIMVKQFYAGKDLQVLLTKEIFEEICKDLFLLCLKPLDDIIQSAEIDKSAIDEIILVGGATRMPLIRENIKLFFGKEPNTSVNPDEVVAMGAAIQASILANQKNPFSDSFVLLDVNPLSLGVETIGGVMDVIIPRNTILPAKKKKLYSNDSDYVNSVMIRIFEGERTLTKDCNFVGEFEFMGLDKQPRGYNKIEITFEVDSDGIISVTAYDVVHPENRKEVKVRSNKNGLTAEQVQLMVEEAKEQNLRDQMNKIKKQSMFRFEDMISSIKINLNKFSRKDSDDILNDVHKEMKWFNEYNIEDIELDELKSRIERLENKYATLIIKVCDQEKKDVETLDTHHGTSVYNDDDDDDEKYINETNETKQEIRQLKDLLAQMCSDTLEFLKHSLYEEEDIDELQELAKDTLIWVHVEKPSKTVVEEKITHFNRICNSIYEKYAQDVQISYLNQLKQLCMSIKVSFEHNLFSLDDRNVDEFVKEIDTCLNVECTDEEAKVLLDKLHKKCQELFHQTVHINNDGTRLEDLI
jgi:molecular chaperone DnaK (HSP70)